LSAGRTLRDNIEVFDNGSLAKGWAIIGPNGFEAGAQGAFSGDTAGLDTDSTPGYLTPGLIDTHIHGGGGFSADHSAADMVSVIDFHQRFGVRSTFLSLVSAPIEEILASIEQAASLIGKDSRFLGLHLEGPFLAHSHKGAHDPGVLHSPSDSELEMLIDAGAGIVRSITVAPELLSDSQVSMLLEAGIEPCLGHTSADFDMAVKHFATGAKVLTHAFNGMKGIHHRDPGPVIAAQENQAVFSELIADGVHVAPEVAKILDATRVILITDAMSATGLADGSYFLGALEVEVVQGVARTHSGSLAGSTLTLDVAVKNFANWSDSAELAFKAAITNPARAYGLEVPGLSVSDRPLIWSKDLELESF
jgi:N-acetylglucosamine-6-phosphate deacetylase